MVTEAVSVPDTAAMPFTISDEMVAAFAALTGDRSSLHVDDAFARRSAYRRRIVHGMLPLGFFPIAVPAPPAGLQWVPTAVTGRFLAPVFSGDPLLLTIAAARPADEDGVTVFDYRVEHARTRTAATVGTIAVACAPVEALLSATTETATAGMLAAAVELNTFTFDEIEPGGTDSLPFRITDASVREFSRLLAGGVGVGAIEPAVLERVWLPSLLAVLLFSTSVGVCLPGASATFLEFAARIARKVELGTTYRLDGMVARKSSATRVIKKDMLVTTDGPGDRVAVVSGRVAAMVNRPSATMPSCEALKAEAVGWGLEGKVVLVTGGSRGIGETTAKLLALCGAKVVVNFHRGADDAARVVDEIGDAGGEATAIQADVADPASVAALVRRAIEQYGAVDVLVNNAARDFRPIPFLDLSWDEVQKDIDVIARGAFLCCQQVIPLMLQRGGGKIVNISTVATDDPPPDQTKYVMAKSALVGLTRSLSIEFASRNIQVNLVVPSFVETDFVAHVPDGFRKRIAQDIPMRRHASPVDVARAVLFLASPHASFTTGQKVMVTGGSAPFL